MKVGRPTTYTQELATNICERIVLGESLRSICREESMPAISSVMKWIHEHSEFSEQYKIAKENQADTLTDDMEDIARDPTIDTQRARLIIDTRKWTASKLKPKKYGDKLDMTSDGKSMAPAEQLTDEQLNAKIADYLKRTKSD